MRIQWQDWLFRQLRKRLVAKHAPMQALALAADPFANQTASPDSGTASVSCAMAWPAAAAAVVSGRLASRGFRSLPATLEVVETVAPSDGGFHARQILRRDPSWLDSEATRKIDCWGDPLRWPAFLLGSPAPFSPTTVRYLATALWLRQNGFIREGGTVVELGVGFGGLAAMNALVSKARSVLLDLPPVTALAKLMLSEVGLAAFSAPEGGMPPDDHCFVSCYAFTELSADTQRHYLDTWIRHARRGIIVSNAGVFARGIGGRSDKDLLAMLHEVGIQAHLSHRHELLGPSDIRCGNTLIHWNLAGEG